MTDTEKLKHFAAICLAAAEGKTIETRKSDSSPWKTVLDVSYHNPQTRWLRIKPWSLPAPPEGEEWHRTDEPARPLNPGERLLLLGETVQGGDVEINGAGRGKDWTFTSECGVAEADDAHLVTSRPLPGDEIAEGWNPSQVTVAQVGKGFRLVSEDEGRGKNHSPEWWLACNKYMGSGWAATQGCSTWLTLTIRTTLSPEALAALDRPKTRDWDRREDVPGPVCWVRRPDREDEKMVTGFYRGQNCQGIILGGEYCKFSDLKGAVWSPTRAEGSWKPCTKEVE